MSNNENTDEVKFKLENELLGFLAKRTRKNFRKTLQEAVISIKDSTASNIEMRKNNPKRDSILKYLDDLGFPKTEKEKLEQAKQLIEEELSNIQLEYEIIEMLLNNRRENEAYEKLKNINIETYHPHYAYKEFLIGRYWFTKDNWRKAKNHYHEAIERFKKNNYTQPDFLPICYNYLGICSYYEEKVEEALHYNKLGLHSFDKQYSKDAYRYYLVANQILYLITLGQRELALVLINKIWSEIDHIEPIRVRLSFYKFHAQLLKSAGEYKQAIEYAKDGISIAKRNNDQNRNFELLIVLGTIYLELKEYELAKTCLGSIILFKELKFPRYYVDSNIYLGMVKLDQDYFDEALKCFNTALKVSMKNQLDFRRIVKIHIIIGNTYRKQKKYQDAIPFYNQAIELAQKHNFLYLQHDALFQSLNCHVILNEKEFFHKKLEELYDLQLKLQRKSEDDLYEIKGIFDASRR